MPGEPIGEGSVILDVNRNPLIDGLKSAHVSVGSALSGMGQVAAQWSDKIGNMLKGAFAFPGVDLPGAIADALGAEHAEAALHILMQKYKMDWRETNELIKQSQRYMNQYGGVTRQEMVSILTIFDGVTDELTEINRLLDQTAAFAAMTGDGFERAAKSAIDLRLRPEEVAAPPGVPIAPGTTADVRQELIGRAVEAAIPKAEEIGKLPSSRLRSLRRGVTDVMAAIGESMKEGVEAGLKVRVGPAAKFLMKRWEKHGREFLTAPYEKLITDAQKERQAGATRLQALSDTLRESLQVTEPIYQSIGEAQQNLNTTTLGLSPEQIRSRGGAVDIENIQPGDSEVVNEIREVKELIRGHIHKLPRARPDSEAPGVLQGPY
jgi:hypothetical protein